LVELWSEVSPWGKIQEALPKNNKVEKGWSMAEVVEHLSSKRKILTLNHSAALTLPPSKKKKEIL
jgi:hypothetical protein